MPRAMQSIVPVSALMMVLAGLTPASLRAQAQSASGIAGVVKDSSGAVLPGVTDRQTKRRTVRRRSASRGASAAPPACRSRCRWWSR